MAANKAFERGFALSFLAPAGVVSGDPVVLGGSTSGGGMAGVVQDSYGAQAQPAGTVSVDLVGVYYLTVTAKSSLSPSVASQVKPGDKLYADGGVYDSASNFTTGFTIDKNSTNTPYFGNAIDGLAAGQTASIRVRLKVTG